MPDPKTYKQHFENKHPKNEMPEELKAVSWFFYVQYDFYQSRVQINEIPKLSNIKIF